MPRTTHDFAGCTIETLECEGGAHSVCFLFPSPCNISYMDGVIGRISFALITGKTTEGL